MKQKIINALKTEYSSLGLSERALDGVASLLEKTITDESGISAAIKEANVVALLRTFQSEVDTERQKASKAAKELEDYKKANPSNPGTGDPKPNPNPNPQNDALAELTRTVNALKEQLAAEKKKAGHEETLRLLTERLRKENCTNEFILKTTLAGIQFQDSDTLDSLVEKYKNAYNANYKEAYGDGEMPFMGSFNQMPTQNDKDEFAGAVARLRSSGVLKKEDPEQKK